MARAKKPEEKFYGRRKGPKLSARKQRLLRDVLPKFQISEKRIAEGNLDPGRLFDFKASEIWLEIGFGKGEHLALQAAKNPGIGFIGCEPFVNGVAGLVTKIHEQGLENIRIYPDDARPLMDALKPASVGRVFLLHPDPWPKKRHQKRRFVSDINLDRLSKLMKSGAELRIGTDHPGYMAWTMILMQNRPDFRWTAKRAEDWRTPPPDWPQTRYAAKARDRESGCAYLTFKKTAKKLD